MPDTHFSLSWNAYKNSICAGLSGLQQNGEFVDMTLAADGHFVKVHQVIIALTSPYLREILNSTECKHPVIFLNKVSYNTLCAVLEYIYTGEVMVAVDNLTELITAGRELQIKGLEDMNIQQQSDFRIKDDDNSEEYYIEEETLQEDSFQTIINESNTDSQESQVIFTVSETNTEEIQDKHNVEDTDERKSKHLVRTKDVEDVMANKKMALLQYTVTNQGNIQMILNRFLYYKKHSNKDGTRQWRCIDYVNTGTKRCHAFVVTLGEKVLQRVGAHIHPFHDKKILNKLRKGAVFSAITEAEAMGEKTKSKSESKGKHNLEVESVEDMQIDETQEIVLKDE